jgi:hypothetical protein
MASTPKKPTAETELLIPGAVDIDPARQLEIEAEARAELEAEQLALAEKNFKAAAKKRMKAAMQAAAGLPSDELVQIRIDLAPHSDRIKIDGVEYNQGYTYGFAPEAIPTIMEIMWRTWMHEEEISDRRNRNNAYRRQQSPILRPAA